MNGEGCLDKKTAASPDGLRNKPLIDYNDLPFQNQANV
jgi:hypothetical protein